MQDRALTPEQKKEVINRLYAAWVSSPHLRLGQLISNVMNNRQNDGGIALFYIEDQVLVRWAEEFVASGETVYGVDDPCRPSTTDTKPR